jgi:hypothetical protein
MDQANRFGPRKWAVRQRDVGEYRAMRNPSGLNVRQLKQQRELIPARLAIKVTPVRAVACREVTLASRPRRSAIEKAPLGVQTREALSSRRRPAIWYRYAVSIGVDWRRAARSLAEGLKKAKPILFAQTAGKTPKRTRAAGNELYRWTPRLVDVLEHSSTMVDVNS